ncbi:carboxypeptidase N subunit 2-like [Mercenaria mercenaria]|uniref:carboxypeptidase N subunit 2-like n=1 Tax=Mercenaria mercenaria TaxID=6596 RepID=UPI00234E88E8|nr:carboxypeptidase N subunit 2-like [Mercenaria mercenaria]
MLILIVLTLNFYITYGEDTCPLTCKCTGHILHCNDRRTQVKIPNNTTEVHITGFEPRPGGEHPFSDPSWSNVLKLELTLQYPSTVNYIANSLFSGLTQLQYLGIHGINTATNTSKMKMNSYSFVGLDKLTTLNLSGNPSLDLWQVTHSLQFDFILPKLQHVIISQLQNLDTEPILYSHMDDFVATLPPRPIKTLIMDKINMDLNMPYISELCLTLEQLLIRNAYIGSVYNQQNFVCSNLKVLDITNSTVPFLQALMKIRFPPSAGHVANFNKFYTSIFTPETVKLDNIIPAYPTPLTFTEGWVFESNGIMFRTKYLNFRQNHMVSLNVSFKNVPFLPGSEIDVSENKLEFIHPRCIDPGKNIRKINLSGNKLYKMEQNHQDQFSQFLQTYIDLEDLDLSSNGLSNIPYGMFQQNIKLQRINLENNYLRTIHFNLKPLVHLQYIDLSNNILVNLDGKVQRQFDTLALHFRLKTDNFTVALNGNNFTCDCQETEFASWIRNSNYLIGTNYYCSFNGQLYNLKGDAINEVQNVCKHRLIRRISIIVSCVIASVICILVIIFILFRRYKKRRIKIMKILNQLKRNHPDQDFLVFLSYCSEDSNFANQQIYPKLNGEICRRVGKHGTYVCIDEHHFRPGFPIVTEIMSNIEKSCVMICITSQPFCDKIWCQMEVEEAYNLRKPIILLIKEEINEANLPKLMSRLFQRNTRARVRKGKDGKYEVHPPWEVLCSSILDLAAGSNAQTDVEKGLSRRTSVVQSKYDTRSSVVTTTNSLKEKSSLPVNT